MGWSVVDWSKFAGRSTCKVQCSNMRAFRADDMLPGYPASRFEYERQAEFAEMVCLQEVEGGWWSGRNVQ